MTRSKSGLCVACRQSEQWWDERTRSYSPFCGKTCRISMSDNPDALPLCYFCGEEEIYVGPDGENSLYCSQTCRDVSNIARRKGRRQYSASASSVMRSAPWSPPATPTTPSRKSAWSSPPSSPSPSNVMRGGVWTPPASPIVSSAIDTSTLIRYKAVPSNKKHHSTSTIAPVADGSSARDGTVAVQQKSAPRRKDMAPAMPVMPVMPVMPASPSCIPPPSCTPSLNPSPSCLDDNVEAVSTSGPSIIHLDTNSKDYQSVYDQFLAAWRHPTSIKGKPTIEGIYRVNVSDEVARRYEAYRSLVESEGHFQGQTFQGYDGIRQLTVGNEQRRFHGTGRKCDIAVNGKQKFCDDQTCGVCGIVANSFALKFFGTKTQRGRFGVGIYFSATSSKSDDYSDNSIRMLPGGGSLKCMLLSKVIVGKGTKLYQSEWNRSGPDAGDHSVIGEVGGVLNYDEVVVYREDACFPQYLVSYSV